MKKFDFLVLVDIWTPETILSDPMPGDHYERASSALTNYEILLNNLNHFEFDRVIINNAKICDDCDINPPRIILDYLENNESISEYLIDETVRPYFSDLFQEKKTFLIGGQSWNACVHGRDMGIISTYCGGHEVYSSPLICIEQDSSVNGFINSSNFVNDKRVNWVKTTNPLVWKADSLSERTMKWRTDEYSCPYPNPLISKDDWVF